VPTLLAALLAISMPVQSAQAHFPIFISAPMREGFYDTGKDTQDSIKDIKGQLAKQKNVNLDIIEDRAKATIVLTVVSRGVGSQAYGSRVSVQQYYRGATLENTPMVANTYWVSTMMQVGTYKKEFTGAYTNTAGSSMGAWGQCAQQIAKNVTSWTVANAELIKAKKGQ
jgi:hypothetical protein